MLIKALHLYGFGTCLIHVWNVFDSSDGRFKHCPNMYQTRTNNDVIPALDQALTMISTLFISCVIKDLCAAINK